VLYKLFNELESVGFGMNGGLIVFSGFYEPFLDFQFLLSAIKMLKDLVTNVKIKINTNGDFLNRNTIKLLDEVHEINVMDYDGLSKAPSWFAEELGLARIKRTPVFDYYVSDSDSILKYKKNTLKHIQLEDRGGALPENINVNGKLLSWYKNRNLRTEPCNEAKVSLAIGSDGSIYPCCHVRGHVPHHKELILGNIKDNKFKDIIEGEKYQKFITRMQTNEYKFYPEACSRCQKRVKLADKYGGKS